MLRVLAAYLRGDRQSCSMVRVPTPEEEDAKRNSFSQGKKLMRRLLSTNNKSDEAVVPSVLSHST